MKAYVVDDADLLLEMELDLHWLGESKLSVNMLTQMLTVFDVSAKLLSLQLHSKQEL